MRALCRAWQEETPQADRSLTSELDKDLEAEF